MGWYRPPHAMSWHHFQALESRSTCYSYGRVAVVLAPEPPAGERVCQTCLHPERRGGRLPKAEGGPTPNSYRRHQWARS